MTAVAPPPIVNIADIKSKIPTARYKSKPSAILMKSAPLNKSALKVFIQFSELANKKSNLMYIKS